MRKRWFLAMPLMFLLSACHGIGQSNYSQKWINQADQNQILVVTFQNPPLMGRVHAMVIGRTWQPNGSYRLQSGAESSEGRAASREGGITLTTAAGEELKLNFEDDKSTLQDENGTIWKVDPDAGQKLEPVLYSK